MAIHFEDEEDEYTEGLDDFAEHLKQMGLETTTEGAELSMSRATSSECARTLTIQKATVSNRSPSPMDVDRTSMQVVERPVAVSPGTPGPTTATRPPYMSANRPSSGTAVPSKRPTDMQDNRGPTSSPPSPSALPQPSKRLHATTSDQRVSPPRGAEPRFGVDLNPFIIAHDAAAQHLIDELQLAWGTTYEVARGITKGRWSWPAVTREKLVQLRGSNAQSAQGVTAIMLGRDAPRMAAVEPWVEYDREQDAILENRGRGLGGMGQWKDKDDWYGGRIQQVGRLVRASNGPSPYSIELEKPEIRRSHRFSRYLGSRRILQIRVADDLLYRHGDEVRCLLTSSKFILCGRVFVPFHAKEGSMYLLETSQDYERGPSQLEGDHFRMSLSSFVCWHNPFAANDQQPISKWSTRWALGLSTSIPTIVFEPENIIHIGDIHASPKDWEGEKPPSEKILTDGCGLVNGAALTQIMRMMKYGSRPTAVQGRIGGSKGMWLLHPDPLEQVADGPAKIWIRKSQTKINLGLSSGLDRAQRTFDLLAYSRVTGPSRLSSQTLVNLSHNGISHDLLKELMGLGLAEEIETFIANWEQPQSMILVWKAVERDGNVVVGRLKRLLAGQARALGVGYLRPSDDQGQEDEEEDNDHLQPLTDVGHKKSSGQPVTLHETVMELLQSGFHPLKSEYLFKKLGYIITSVVDDYVKKFHIPVTESREAYIVPDPCGVLEEGQIHFRSSDPIVNLSTGEQTDIILGDVLVSRNPTRLPSDIQKVKAVAHPQLRNYVNVIVFPIKGKQSLASYLGGGDYDGDTVLINWNKSLVEQFNGSPLCKEPAAVKSCFARDVETVRHFDKKVSKLGVTEAQLALQEILLLGLAETRVGLYSIFHDAAVYKLGYADPRTIHLAYMFTTCLDASKTGLRVKLPVFQQDRQQWGVEKPWYAKRQEEGNNRKNSSQVFLEPREGFILDALVMKGEELRVKVLKDYEELQEKVSKAEDQDLSKPWNTAKAKAAQAKSQGILGFSKNLDDIQAHVDEAWRQYKRAVEISKGAEGPSKNAPYDEVSSFFAKPPSFKGFVCFSEEDVKMLKASLASMKSHSFAFSVAFHDVCLIKARATGNIAITQQFAQSITIPNIVAHMLTRANDPCM